MTTRSLDRLNRRRAAVGSALTLGIDPHPDRLPAELSPDLGGVERFARGLVEAVADAVCAIKVNAAFFEAFGSPGWAALERLRADVPVEHFFVLDAKRGDIGTTAERYAEAIFGRLDADAVTLSPYLGADAIEPFLAHPGRVVYVLARTSNPSAGQFQDLAVDGEPLFLHVARWVADRWPDPRVGLVVGATAPVELAMTRAVNVEALNPWSDTVTRYVSSARASAGSGATPRRDHRRCAALLNVDGALAPGLISVSRGIAEASSGSDWASAAASAASAWGRRLNDAVLDSGPCPAPAAVSEVQE